MLAGVLREERGGITCPDDYEVIFFRVAGAPHVDFIVLLDAERRAFAEWLAFGDLFLLTGLFRLLGFVQTLRSIRPQERKKDRSY